MKDDFPSFYCKYICILVLLLFIKFLILHVATTLETALFLAEVSLTWGSMYFHFVLYCVSLRHGHSTRQGYFVGRTHHPSGI